MALSRILGHPAVAAALTGYAGHTEGLRREREKRQQYNREVAKMGINRKLGMIDRSMEATLEGERARGRLDPKSKYYDPVVHQQYEHRESEHTGRISNLTEMIADQKRQLEEWEEQKKIADKLAKAEQEHAQADKQRQRIFNGMIGEVRRGETTPMELNTWMAENPEIFSTEVFKQQNHLFKKKTINTIDKTALKTDLSFASPLEIMYEKAVKQRQAHPDQEPAVSESEMRYEFGRPGVDRSSGSNLGEVEAPADSITSVPDTVRVAPVGGTSDRSGFTIGQSKDTPPMPLTTSAVMDQQNQPPMPLTGSQVHDQRGAAEPGGTGLQGSYGPQATVVITRLMAEKGLSEDEAVQMMKKARLDLNL